MISANYEHDVCPLCRSDTRNGRCENFDCHFHLHPLDADIDLDDYIETNNLRSE